MPIYSIQGPDNKIYDIEGPEGATDEQVVGALKQHLAGAPKSGFVPALKAGVSGLKSDMAGLAGRTGIMDPRDAEAYQREQAQYQAQTFAPTKKGWAEAPLGKAAELLGGSLPYMAAPVAAGAGAAVLGAPAIIGAGAAGAVSAAQFTGSNLSRQQQEGKTLEGTDLQSAALAALPQAALDMVGLRMIPGIRGIFKAAGKEMSEEAAARLAQQTIRQKATDYAKATGKAMTAEGTTEAVQQVFERLQAGLKVGGPEATQEYMDSFIGGAVLGGVISPAGRYMERGKQQNDAQASLKAKDTAAAAVAQKQQDEADAQLAAKKQTPEYLQGLDGKYQALLQANREARASIGPKPKGEGDPSANLAWEAKNKALEAQLKNPEFAALTQEHASRRDEIDALNKAAAPLTQPIAEAPAGTVDLFGAPVQGREQKVDVPTAAQIEVQRTELTRQAQGLEALLEQHRDAAAKAPDMDSTEAAVQRFEQTQAALKDAQATLAQLPAAPKAAPTGDALNKQMETAQKALTTAKENGDTDAMKRYIAKVRKLQTENPGLFTKAHETAIKADEAVLGQEMGAGREQAAAQTAKVDSEVEGIRRIATPREPSVIPQVRQERGTQREITDMERGAMNTGVTDQPGLFQEVQGNTGVQESTKQTQAVRQDLALQLQDARRRMKDDPQKYRPVADRLLERMRDLSKKGFMMPEARGTATADMAETLAGARRPHVELESADVTQDRRAYATDATPESVRRDIAALPENIHPEADALLRRLHGNFNAFTADPQRTALLAGWVHGVRTQQVNPTHTKDITVELDRLEIGKRSESEGSKRALQTDAFPDTTNHGIVFNSYAEFEQYLAGDAVKDARESMGRTVSTAARAHATVAPMEERATELQQSVANLQRMLAHTKALGDTAREGAITKLEAAVESAKKLRAALDVKLTPARKGLEKARAAATKSAEAVAKISDSIAKNTAKFNRDADVQAAAAKVAGEQAKFAAALQAKDDATLEEALKMSGRVIAATNAHRTVLQAHVADSQKLQERSILAYLNKDMDLTLRLRDATQSLEKVAAARNRAERALHALDKEINGTPEAVATMRAALSKVAHAKGVLTKATQTAEQRRTRLVDEIASSDDARQALVRDIEVALAPVSEARDARTKKMEESQADRERANGAERAREQARRERLAGLPGATVSHAAYRDALDRLEESPARIARLEEKAADEALPDTTRNKAKHDAKTLRETAFIAHGVLSRDPEHMVAAKAVLERRVADLQSTYDAKRVAINEPGQTQTTLDSRKKEARELARELKMLKKFSGDLAGRAEVKAIATPEETAAQRAEAGERLPPRKIGPIVRPVVGPGRVTQGGARRGVTGPQAVRAAKVDTAHEQAMLKLSHYEDLIERNEAALDTAKEAGDDALIAKHESYADRLERARAAAEKEVAKAGVRPEDAANKPTAERTTTPLSVEAVDAAHDGRTVDVAADLAKNGSTPEIRDAAAKLQPLLLRTKFAIDENLTHNGDEVPALYSPTQNKIIARTAGLTEQDVIHEMTHAATDSVLLAPTDTLTPSQREGRTGLENMWKGVEHNPNFIGEHGATSVREFAAEVYSNEQFRAKLDAMGKPLTLLERFKNFVRKMLGMPVTPSGKAKDFVEQVMSASRVFKAADVPSAKRGGLDMSASAALIREKDPEVRDLLKNKSTTALAAHQQLVDARSALQRAFAIGKTMPGVKADATSAEAAVRQADARELVTNTVLDHGGMVVVRDKATGQEQLVAKDNPNLRSVTDSVDAIPARTAEGKWAAAQVYMTVRRAMSIPDGWARLGLSPTEQATVLREYNTAVANPEARAALEAFGKAYHAFNAPLMRMLGETGYLPKAVAERLAANKDYIPWLRPGKGDALEFLDDSGRIIASGDMRTMPFLQALKGSENKLMPFERAVFENVATLSTMAADNFAAKKTAYALQGIGKTAKVMQIAKGEGPTGHQHGDVMRFKDEPDPHDPHDSGDRWIKIDTTGTAAEGIPSALLAQATAGVASSLPTTYMGKVGRAAGSLLRAGVTRNPGYLFTQLFKDPMNASLSGNLSRSPIMAMLKTMDNFQKILRGKSESFDRLSRMGALPSQIYEGGSNDLAKIAMAHTGARTGVYRAALNYLDKLAHAADSATRIQGYEDVLAAGGTEVEAGLHAREMQNFHTRGASESVRNISAFVPFFGAQIQGLNALVRSARGTMPAQELLRTKQTFLNRVLAMSAMSMVYAAAMDGDDEWDHTDINRKLGYIPLGFKVDGKMVGVPTMFETGMLGWSLPVAMYEYMKGRMDTPHERTALRRVLMNGIPGVPIPALIKGGLEVATNHNFFTGREVVAPKYNNLDVSEQVDSNTAELHKLISSAFVAAGAALSPIEVAHLSDAYFGQLPSIIARATDQLFANEEDSPTGAKPTPEAHKRPFVGRFINGSADERVAQAYDNATKAAKTEPTFKAMAAAGRTEAAQDYLREQIAAFGAPNGAQSFMRVMGELRKAEKAITNNPDPRMTADVKAAKIKELREKQGRVAEQYLRGVENVRER